MVYPVHRRMKLVSHEEDIIIMMLRLCGGHIHRHICSYNYIALDSSRYKISYVIDDKSVHCALPHHMFYTGEPHCCLTH